eukprot:139147-Prymnesium_polylepis.1
MRSCSTHASLTQACTWPSRIWKLDRTRNALFLHRDGAGTAPHRQQRTQTSKYHRTRSRDARSTAGSPAIPLHLFREKRCLSRNNNNTSTQAKRHAPLPGYPATAAAGEPLSLHVAPPRWLRAPRPQLRAPRLWTRGLGLPALRIARTRARLVRQYC